MATKIGKKFYELSVWDYLGNFSIELRNVENEKDYIPIGIGTLKDYEIDEQLKERLENYLNETYDNLLDQYEYLCNEETRKEVVKLDAENCARDYIYDWIKIELSQRMFKRIAKEAEEYFYRHSDDTWETVKAEVKNKLAMRLEQAQFIETESATMENLRDHCNEQWENNTDAFERRTWRERKNVLDEVLNNIQVILMENEK